MRQDTPQLEYRAKPFERRKIVSARSILEMAVAIVLGWCVVVLPVLLDPATRHYPAAFMPFMRDAVEGLKVYSLALLFVLGLGLGTFARTPPWVLGFASVATFPAWSAVDMAMGGDHNLFPIEWMFYGFYGVIASAGATLGWLMRNAAAMRLR